MTQKQELELVNKLSLKITAISLATEAEVEGDQLLTLAKEIYEWLMEEQPVGAEVVNIRVVK